MVMRHAEPGQFVAFLVDGYMPGFQKFYEEGIRGEIDEGMIEMRKIAKSKGTVILLFSCCSTSSLMLYFGNFCSTSALILK